jgi:hypothetical protein
LAFGLVELQHGQVQVSHVVAALGAAGGFAGHLDGREEEGGQDGDDGDDDEHFDERECATTRCECATTRRPNLEWYQHGEASSFVVCP